MDGEIPSFQRPSSDKVDIHVLIVPASLWRADLRFAYSSTCLESVSSGFVRVYPSTPLSALRMEIARQLDLSLLPDGYVFLRNVGRHLTWVTAKQEPKLKAKLFVPPLAPCPELYILDARCLKDWLPLGELSPHHSQKNDGYLHNNSFSYPPTTEVHSHGQTTEGLAGTYLSVRSHQHPVAATGSNPLRTHLSNFNSHPLHTQAPHSNQQAPHSNQQTPHTNQQTPHPNQQAPHSNLSFTSHTNQLPYSRHRSPHHNHTYAHSRATALPKPPNTDAVAATHRRRKSRHTSLQAPQIAAADSATGRHSNPATVGGSYRLLHKELHRRDHGPLKKKATMGGHPSEIPTPHSKASSFKHSTGNSYGHTEPTTLDASPVSVVRTDARDGANGRYSGSSGESSEGEVAYQHRLHERLSPNHPMVIQAADAIEKALYGDCSSKNGAGVATERGKQGTDRCNAGGGGGRDPAVAVSNEHRLRNEQLQETHRQDVSSSRLQSSQEKEAEMQGIVAGNGQDKTAQVTCRISRDTSGESHSDSYNNKRGTGSLRVQSSSQEVGGVRTRTETHPPKKRSRKLFDRKEFEQHTQTAKGMMSNTIPPTVPAHPTNLHGSLPVATDKISAVPLKIPSKKADFSPNLPLPPIDKRTAKSSSDSSSTPSTSEVNDLLARIRITKQECAHLQQTKASLGTNFRNLQLVLKTRREDADKEWKRRFFLERKATAGLEDRIRGLKGEIQTLQGKLDRQRDSHMRDLIHGTAPLTETPSQHSNMKIQCRRLDLAIQELKQRLLTTRQRLAAEKEAHKGVLAECRALRRECMGKKIACTRTRGHPVVQHS